MFRGRFAFALVVFVAAAAGPIAAQSQSLDPSLYADLRWRLVGPFRGGWATCAAGVPDDPAVYYFGARGRRSVEDRRRRLDLESDLRPRRLRVGRRAGDRAVGPEGDLRRHRPDPGALRHRVGRRRVPVGRRRRDVDARRPRSHAGDRPDRRRSARCQRRRRRRARAHVRPATASAASSARRTAGRPGRTCSSWTRSTGGADLAADPENPSILYASLWQARNYPWLSYFKPMVGSGSAVYKSRDGGPHLDEARGRRLAGGRRRANRPRGRAGRSRLRPRGRRGRPSGAGLPRRASIAPTTAGRTGAASTTRRVSPRAT